MRIQEIRRSLGQIEAALRDVPPGSQSSGESEGVISHLLHRPDSDPECEVALPCQFDLTEPGDEDWQSGDFDPVFEWGAESEEALCKLGHAANRAILQSVMAESGSDALGHYVSFHIRGAQWGATIKLSGLAWLAVNTFDKLPVDWDTKLRLAFQAILQHELFHFATDVAVSRAEVGQQRAWFWPAKDARARKGIPYSEREEMLANAWMLRAFRTALPRFRVRGKQSALRKFVHLQPKGYRDALSLRPTQWAFELGKLVHEYASHAERSGDNALLWGAGYDWPCQYPIWPRIDWRDCALHLVDDSTRFGVPAGWLTFFSSLSRVEESEQFKRQINKLAPQQRQRWDRTVRLARSGLTAGHDFKPWPKGGKDVWSIRVDRGFRAHLRRDRDPDRWTALEIGDHKSMGHG